jgi:hypothetical protein
LIQGVFYIESQGNDRKVVRKALEDLVGKLKEEKGVRLKSASFGDLVEDGGSYSITVELDLSFESLKDYLMCSMKFGPSAITIESPKKIILTAKEFLEVIGEVTAFTKRVMNKYGIRFTFPETEDEVKIGLEEDEIDALLDQGALRVRIVVERSEEPKVAQRKFLSAVSKEVFLNKVKTSRLEERTLIAIHAFLYEPKALIDLSIKHTPVLIELLEPEEVELSMFEIQDIGVELAATYFEMAHHTLHKASRS